MELNFSAKGNKAASAALNWDEILTSCASRLILKLMVAADSKCEHAHNSLAIPQQKEWASIFVLTEHLKSLSIPNAGISPSVLESVFSQVI